MCSTANYNELTINNIIKIQSVYKGYYIRNKIKKFYKLPRDIQKKIIWYMNNDIYVRHYNSTLTKLIHNKIATFVLFYDDHLNYYKSAFQRNLYINLSGEFLTELKYILRLIVKYEQIIDFIKIKEYLFKINKFVYFHYYNDSVFNYDCWNWNRNPTSDQNLKLEYKFLMLYTCYTENCTVR